MLNINGLMVEPQLLEIFGILLLHFFILQVYKEPQQNTLYACGLQGSLFCTVLLCKIGYAVLKVIQAL